MTGMAMGQVMTSNKGREPCGGDRLIYRSWRKNGIGPLDIPRTDGSSWFLPPLSFSVILRLHRKLDVVISSLEKSVRWIRYRRLAMISPCLRSLYITVPAKSLCLEESTK